MCPIERVAGDVFVPLWVKKGSLKFPKPKDTPVVMVGPGTGVAPFRSALQERMSEGKHGESFTSVTKEKYINHSSWFDSFGVLVVFLLFSQRPVLWLSL